MTKRARLLLAGLFAGLIFAGTLTPVLAHVCLNADKPDGAGSAGSATLLIDPVTGEETFIPGADLQINPHSGRLQGGFFEITVEVIGVGVVAVEDVFAQVTLPAGAHNSGPGDNACDGKGVDNAEACGP